MNRRTFMLLSGSASAALLASSNRLTAYPPRSGGGSADGRLRFQLDDHYRWSLWYHGDGAPVPLLAPAALGAWIGDRFVALGDLEDIASGTRRPPGGEALVVRGRGAGVYLEGEFYSSDGGPAPQAAVTLSIFADRSLPTVKGVRFFERPAADVLPGDGQLVAHLNGYHSWDSVRVGPVTDLQGVAGHGTAGLTRGTRGLAVSFDAGEPGEARLGVTAAGLEAVSDWLPARPLRADGDAATLRLCYVPAGDGLDAQRALFRPASPVDQERLTTAVVPAGWCSWYELYGNVTEADMIQNLEFCATHFDRRHFRVIQLDDGFQKATGDWEMNDKFPHGHHWLTNQIHGHGFLAGLWVAPFAVTDRSGVPSAHPTWLLRDETGNPLVWDTRDDWGGRVYSLDGAHPDVQQWLSDLARRVTREWGYDYLKIDFLLWATKGAAHHGGRTHAEAYRLGLSALREGLATGAFLLGCGAPLQHSIGYVDGMRIGTDVDASWAGVQGPARAAALRSFYHRGTWLNDPDCLVVRPPLSEGEARAWATLVALSGGMNILSDNLPKLPAERIPLLQRTLPVAPMSGHPVGTAALEPEVAPALLDGDEAIRIAGPWRFRAGDDAAFAAPDFDDAAWEEVTIPHRFAEEYDGFGWYRARFRLPARSAGAATRTVALELGKIDDVDETFINGVKIGQTGEFPPAYGSRWSTFRRYTLPPEAVRWGAENVLAIRAYDGGGPGGFFSTRRERPPAHWVIEGASAWWTVALVNWGDEPRDVSVALAELGLPAGGARWDAYDVWTDTPKPDVRTRLTATIPPHEAFTLALRRGVTRPQVIGSTRHVVQGAVDVADEKWDAATRTLSARAVNLDSRPYRVTIAAPRGMRPGACTADRPCTVTRLESGHVVLAWEGDAEGRDIAWKLRFRAST